MTFNGWLVVAMPSTPAPRDVQFSVVSNVGISTSPFTGQQQTYNWGGQAVEATVTMPPMDATDGAIWAAFFVALNGIENVCQLTATCFASNALIPPTSSFTTYWRLKDGIPQYSVSKGLIYGMSFQLREAK